MSAVSGEEKWFCGIGEIEMGLMRLVDCLLFRNL